jgi:hypothetical protein
LLALVLVYPLDLNVEQAGGVDGDAIGFLDVLRQANLVGVLDLLELLAELLVIDVTRQSVSVCW